MRPKKIELQYFGPYEHEVIDFDRFRDQSLFLVAGNTGAGKTTIFDAMCYALFGQTTNDKYRSAAALRSDFAPANRETKVTFTFVHQGNEYQITRRPKQTLRGRGGKLVTHNQAVSLIYPLNSKEPHEITKIKDADNFITDLLNLTSDQFAQIVVLPQGKFRQFLDSDSNAKESLLMDLFNTGLYDKWAATLGERLSKQKKVLDDQQVKLQTLKENVSTVDPQLNATDWEQAASAEVTKLNQHLTELSNRVQAQRQKATALHDQLNVEKELQRYLVELASAKKDATKLQAQQTEITTIEQQVAALKWFHTQQPAYQRWQDGEKKLGELQKAIKQNQSQQEKFTTEQVTATEKTRQLKAQQPEIERVQARASDLVAKLPLFKQVGKLSTTVDQLNHDLTTVTTQEKNTADKLTTANERLADLTTKLSGKDDLTAEQITLTERQADHKQLLREVKQYDKVSEQLHREQWQQLTVELETARGVAKEKQQQLDDLNDAYARHQIAVLATRLKPGSPCPVCGATDHPAPAHLDDPGDLVSDAEIKAATQAARSAQNTVSQLAEQVKQSKDHFTSLNSQLDDCGQVIAKLLGLTKLPADWRQQSAARGQQLTHDQKVLKERQRQFDRWQQEQAKVQKRVKDLQTTFEQEKATVQQAQQELVKQQTLLTEKQANLPAKIKDGKTAKEQVKTWQQQVEDFNYQLENAQKKLQQATKDLAVNKSLLQKNQTDREHEEAVQKKRKANLTKALKDFDASRDWQFWEQATAQLSQLESLQATVQDYKTKVHDNELQQQRLVALINERPTPDLKTTRQQLDAANDQLEHWQQELGQVTSQRDDLEQIRQQVIALVGKNGLLNKKINQLQTLTDVMTGRTENHLSLERYVLQAYFQDVLSAANVQLDRLTNGRYQFELSQESHGAGAKWSGLEVNVYDDNAGRTRSARTLSGGESFMASLSLALALCQIIQEQSGGITIDALFIDEGFGSLDQQALEDALHALQELEGHRMIGIISHVTELEEQIPDQLRVTSINGRSKISYQHDFQA
ncbi:AAA family ATPase [Limosilactobacillus sp.]|uniref:AAA family ATPase n=1 Tax=Limosilactobacillus sp. TaxID=2773925 RepID=UPI003F0F85DC